MKVSSITGYVGNALVGNGHLDPGMHVLTMPFAMEALAGRSEDPWRQGRAGTPKTNVWVLPFVAQGERVMFGPIVTG